MVWEFVVVVVFDFLCYEYSVVDLFDLVFFLLVGFGIDVVNVFECLCEGSV